jgi:hypothetical protein
LSYYLPRLSPTILVTPLPSHQGAAHTHPAPPAGQALCRRIDGAALPRRLPSSRAPPQLFAGRRGSKASSPPHRAPVRPEPVPAARSGLELASRVALVLRVLQPQAPAVSTLPHELRVPRPRSPSSVETRPSSSSLEATPLLLS